jgi:hypothetical protein
VNEDIYKELFNKLDKMNDKIGHLTVNQAIMNKSLEEHMRRTEAAEKSIDLLKTSTERSIDILKQEMKPIQLHVSRMNGGLWWLGVATTIVSILAGLTKIASVIWPVVEKLYS